MTEGLLILYYEPSEQGDYDKAIDITDLVETLQLTTAMDAQPGQATLNIISDNLEYTMGACIQILDGDEGIFTGYIFTVSMDNGEKIQITALDQSRYLKNQDTFVFSEAMTVDALFKQLCNDWRLQMGQVDASSFSCKPSIHEGRSLWDVIDSYCEETFVGTGKLYMVRDNFGKLELRDVENLHTGLRIDDISIIQKYRYEVSIDKNTFNQIKIGKDSASKTERVWTIVKDSTTIDQWGLLQYHKKFGEQTPSGQMQDYAEKLLKAYNKHTQTLTLDCFGDFRVRAGSGIQIQLDAFKSTADNQNYIVKSCTHVIKNKQHQMQLELAMDRV